MSVPHPPCGTPGCGLNHLILASPTLVHSGPSFDEPQAFSPHLFFPVSLSVLFKFLLAAAGGCVVWTVSLPSGFPERNQAWLSAFGVPCWAMGGCVCRLWAPLCELWSRTLQCCLRWRLQPSCPFPTPPLLCVACEPPADLCSPRGLGPSRSEGHPPSSALVLTSPLV